VTYIIAEPCIDIKDRSCVDVCPVDCIHEADRILVIDPEECIDCGACEPECPVEAIFPEDALPDKWNAFVEINYAYPKGMAVVDELTEKYAAFFSMNSFLSSGRSSAGWSESEVHTGTQAPQSMHSTGLTYIWVAVSNCGSSFLG